VLLYHLPPPRVQCLDELLECYPDRGRVSVQNWRVTSRNRRRVVYDDDPADERFCDGRWLVGVAHDLTSPDLILCNTAHVEPYVVSRLCLGHSHMMSLDRLHLTKLPEGMKITLSPSFNTPVSTRPTGTVP